MATLVQSVSGTTTGTSLTITLSATTAGNTLVITAVSSCTPANPTISGITLGGTSIGSQVATAGSVSADSQSSFMWEATNIAGGQTSVVITFTTGNTGSICATVMEWNGLGTADASGVSANGTSGTTFSSGASGTTKQANEVAIGCCGAFNGSGIGTITGPSSPWSNLTQETSASTHVGLLTGYDVLSATGTATYSGSFGVTASYAAIVVTFRAGPVVDLPVTTNQVAASSGVATSTTSFSPPAGSLVVVIASWMFGTNATGVTWTCQDSSSVAYSSGVQHQDINGVGGAMIFYHYYASAPGSITVKVTCSNTGAADCQISPRIVIGAASTPGPNTLATANSSNSTAVTGSLTTTKANSICYFAADWATSTTGVAAANTTLISTWSDATQGDTGSSGLSTAPTVSPGATTFGFTAGSATEFGLVGMEVVPLVAGTSVAPVVAMQAVKRAAYY